MVEAGEWREERKKEKSMKLRVNIGVLLYCNESFSVTSCDVDLPVEPLDRGFTYQTKRKSLSREFSPSRLVTVHVRCYVLLERYSVVDGRMLRYSAT